jgi:hypothetical protein
LISEFNDYKYFIVTFESLFNLVSVFTGNTDIPGHYIFDMENVFYLISKDEKITEEFWEKIPDSSNRILPAGQPFNMCVFDPAKTSRHIQALILQLIPESDKNHLEMLCLRKHMINFIVKVQSIKQYALLPMTDLTSKHCQFCPTSLYFLLRAAGIQGLPATAKEHPTLSEMLSMFMKR